MNNERTRILITNDDGIHAPGLAALRDAANSLGLRCSIVAPAIEQSMCGHRVTTHSPVKVEARGADRHAVHGTPADCVRIALVGLGLKPDWVLSGINQGANMGDDTLYSGTVAAAMEGFLFGIPAIAFSQTHKGWDHLDAAKPAVRALVERVLAHGLSEAPWLLNVNIPNRADAASLPWRVARLGRRHASEPVIRQVNPRGETMYWIGPAGDARDAGEGTDFHATTHGCISITPLQVDLTDHPALSAWSRRLEAGPAR